MSPQDLLSLLGARNTDPAVESALVYFRVRNRPEVEIDEDDSDGPVVGTQSWVKNSRAGIEFGFDDEAAWRGLDETQFGQGPMVLTEIYLYGSHQGVRPYQDALPFGLTLLDDRATVRKRMASYEATRHSYIRDTWDVAEIRITVSYTDDESAIAFVLCALREPPLPPLDYAIAPAPAIDTLIGLLAASLDDPAVESALDPLGLQDRIDRIEETGEADLLTPYGLLVNFAMPPKKRKQWRQDALLAGMTFHQERELDARRWPGDMPYGVTFDDSPETVADKLARAPDAQEDEDFSGYAVWNEPSLTFHVLYSTMDNRVMRVSMFAPGLWKEPVEDDDA
ncbi:MULTISPECIES: hypothetical protein [Caballeronia]|uniref:Uncharacterized protein n=2 Tax=Caballeronia TaxID=1827195 RepID=A0AA37MSN1_9BURK|nr:MULTISPECIES: hypothetical protein [Caballeronia]GJH30151.1 hypothetical protein CBA19CS42_36565 [Caballeronia novacaledonica]